MQPGNHPGGQRDGNGGGGNAAEPGNGGGSQGIPPFTSAAYYGGGNGGGTGVSEPVLEARPAPRVALQRSGSTGKLGVPRAIRVGKGAAGRGGRHGLAAVTATLYRKRALLLCIAAVIFTYFGVSSQWLSKPAPQPAGFRREHVKLLLPLPVNNTAGSEPLLEKTDEQVTIWSPGEP